MAAVRLLTSHLLLLLYLLPLSLSATDNEALLKFKQSLINTKALDSWVPNTSPCNNKYPWAGIMCNGGIMTGLHLAEMNLSGKIDVDPLLQIPTLRTMTFVNNSFSGPIPEFNRLVSLKALYLSFNAFSGNIPSDFFSKMASLRKLWLSENKFSGNVPASLGQIPNLIDLRLQNNEFSGTIPAMEQKSLATVDMSNNKLEGEIPSSLSRFDRRSFDGNLGLCGKPLGNECNQKPEKSIIVWAVIGVIACALALTLVFRARRKEDKFNKLGKENLDEVVERRIPSSNRRSINSSQKRGSTRKGSQKGMGDLVVVNEEKGIFGLADLMKASAEVLGNGGLGSAYKAVLANGVAVVVKRIREMNKTNKDVFDSEMRRLGSLRHRNILTPLAYHNRKDEKLFMSEYCPKGSLLHVLHGDRGISHAELNWPTRLKIIKGVADGMGFLHSEFASYELPHGNLKSSNILLDSTYEPLLTDYAFHPLINTQAGQALFAYKSPEAILYQKVTPKSDVYCLGIIILEILTGKFPCQYVSNQKGGTDIVQWVQSAVSEKSKLTELIDPEIASAANSLAHMEKLLHIGAACTEGDLDQRIDMKEAIRRIEEIQV